MKLRSLVSSLALGLAAAASLAAQEPLAPPTLAAPSDAAINDVKALVEKVRAKIKNGETSANALAPELAEYDTLITKHAGDKEGAGLIALMKAALYIEVLGDEARGRETLAEIPKDYPGTLAATNVAPILRTLDEPAKPGAAEDAHVGQTAPELHFLWSSQAGLKTLSSLKGRVVVLDFWATWCGPCLRSFPQVREHVAHFQGSPVTFLGVTSIQGYVANLGARIETKDDPAKEMALMTEFMKTHEMTWDVAFSEERVFNPAYGIEGIPFVAIIAPDGTLRHAGLHPGDPSSDIAGKVEAILQEFKLPLPVKS